MVADSEPPHTPRVGLVLAGGAARGAYEVGVVEHIAEEVSKDLGYDVPLDILCGTSVGAINVCTLAAFADEPRGRVARLRAVWEGLRVEQIVRTRARGVYGLLRTLMRNDERLTEGGALFDPIQLEQLLRRAIPFERIDTNLRARRLLAVTVSATQIATGRTVVFVQRRRATPLPWEATPNVLPRAVRLRPAHALASAAVPLLFPAVQIDGHAFCDGGLRQNIPLSPARRLGATGLIVVNPKHRRAPSVDAALQQQREEAFPGMMFLLGKTLNALLLDRIDNDIDRLDKINVILEAGSRRYGDGFVAELNEQLGHRPGTGLKRLHTVHIRASQDIGELSAEHVRSPDFHVGGVLGRAMKQIAEEEAAREADLLSYVLFDGDFAAKLIDLGRADARAQHGELCALFDELRQGREPGGES